VAWVIGKGRRDLSIMAVGRCHMHEWQKEKKKTVVLLPGMFLHKDKVSTEDQVGETSVAKLMQAYH